MSLLQGKNILIGITGGIAAYKIPELIRQLQKEGANIKVILTENARHFAEPELFGYLTGEPAYISGFMKDKSADIQHIRFQEWADLLLIAPATANILGKFNHGIADDLLSTTFLAMKCPVLVCPAMNTEIYHHPSVQNNIQELKEKKVLILEPSSGLLLCGAEGAGRLPDLPRIILEIRRALSTPLPLFAGKSITITLGAAREYLDSVRFLSNPSSGKMGLAIADACYEAGAEKNHLITGEGLTISDRPYTVFPCISTTDYLKAYQSLHEKTDLAFFCAALADFTPAKRVENKIKKEGLDQLLVELIPAPDVALWAGENRRNGQTLIGFSAEDTNGIDNSKNKLTRKKLDAILYNHVGKSDSGFLSDFNSIHVIFGNGNIVETGRMNKQELAVQIIRILNESLSIM